MLAGRLQRSTTSLAARVEDAVRIRLHLPSATGSGAALCRGLRASSRRYHRPSGQTQQPGRTQDWIKLGGKVSEFNQEVGVSMTDIDKRSEEDRRKFLATCGKFAAVTPPAITLLLSTSLTSDAIAASGGGAG